MTRTTRGRRRSLPPSYICVDLDLGLPVHMQMDLACCCQLGEKAYSTVSSRSRTLSVIDLILFGTLFHVVVVIF